MAEDKWDLGFLHLISSITFSVVFNEQKTTLAPYFFMSSHFFSLSLKCFQSLHLVWPNTPKSTVYL